eukprot:m.62496 g.62496  ORF g.62496 m.62496 type:complete len:95 (+) comp13395_c0_seq1:1033-1317(+)
MRNVSGIQPVIIIFFFLVSASLLYVVVVVVRSEGVFKPQNRSNETFYSQPLHLALDVFKQSRLFCGPQLRSFHVGHFKEDTQGLNLGFICFDPF